MSAASHGVLVVEDDRDIREVLVDLLGEAGFHAIPAGNGAEALDVLERRAANPCLILLDMMMPIMDGPTFLKQLKGKPHLNKAPVMILSAFRDAVEKARAELAWPVVAALVKPPSLDELMGLIRKHC